ncbi:MAG: hypothetical protein ACYTF6_09270, partial [Planctomycetota bacterium]
MGGFAGEFVFSAARAELDVAVAMARRVAHRGPQQSGSILSADGRCAIGSHTLTVIDPGGPAQPTTSADGSVTVACDGEIYNSKELREQLGRQGVHFQTSGATELLLGLYARDGERMLQSLSGMFALALYDASAGMLLLARDRLGQKPLWYALLADRIIFASEAKAVLAHP